MSLRVKKVAYSHFFEKFGLSLSPAGTPAKYENLRFSSVLTHMRAGWDVKGCGP